MVIVVTLLLWMLLLLLVLRDGRFRGGGGGGEMGAHEGADLGAVGGFGEGGAEVGAAGVALFGFPFFGLFCFFWFLVFFGGAGRMIVVVAAFAEPEAGGREGFVRVVVGVVEGLGADVGEGFEGRGAAVAGQEDDVGEGEGEFLLDFEEGHGLFCFVLFGGGKDGLFWC